MAGLDDIRRGEARHDAAWQDDAARRGEWPQIGDVLAISTEEEFDRAALAVFRRQAVECAPYAEYLSLIGVEAADVTSFEQIPYLPIELFKSHRVYCGAAEPEAVFTSSSTGGEGPSRHYVAHVTDYERTYTRGFELFYGAPERWSIFALLPSYLEREGSSLVRMADGLIARGRAAGRGGGFYLHDHDRLLADIAATAGPRILLGVSYALLDLAELLTKRGEKLPEGTIVMETGGMKGRREEISKAEMHTILRTSLGVSTIHSEYGMAELMSQAYSTGEWTSDAGNSWGASGANASAGSRDAMNGTAATNGTAIFRTPPWMRVSVRDLTDPFDVRRDGRGGINVADLANLSSCAFIQTQDLGRCLPSAGGNLINAGRERPSNGCNGLPGSGGFTLEGRVARSDIRGCNLLVQ